MNRNGQDATASSSRCRITIPEEAVTDSSANFEALSEDIENRVSTDSDLPMQPKTERLNSEDQFFADRMEKYTQELKDWMAINDMQEALQLEMEGVKKELAEIDKNKPQPPAFEEREWVSVDKKFKLKASLVSTDYRTATLQKLDRTQVSVPRDKLCEGDRIYIEKAFDQLAPHRLSLAKWQKVRDAATERLQLLSLRATSTRLPGPKPELPTREDIANELKAEESLARQKHNEIENAQTRRIADERAAKLQAAKQLAETESNYDGLVLMRKTVSATLGGSNARISGVVENRRNTKLKYAQITFNLYDASGAQVGSAIDTITGLEPGGRWKFTATDFGIECVRFKFSELVGF